MTVLMLLVSSCNFLGPIPPETVVPSSRVDADILVSQDCIEACWQGLIPGKTEIDDVQAFFSRGFQRQYPARQYNDIFTGYGGLHNDGYSVSMLVQEDVLYQIVIRNALDLQLGYIIDTLGVPDYMLVQYDSDLQNNHLSATITIYYPDSGYSFYTSDRDGLDIRFASASQEEVTICLGEDDFVNRVDVVAPGSITSLVASNYVVARLFPVDVEKIVDDMQAWPGFSCIDMPFPMVR